MSVSRSVEHGAARREDAACLASWRTGAGRPTARDVLLAAVVAGVSVWVTRAADKELLSEARHLDGLGVALVVLACAPVAFRRTDPRAAAVVALLISFAGGVLDYPMAAPMMVGLGLVGLATSRAEVRLTGTLGVFSGVLVTTSALIGARGNYAIVTIGAFAVGMLPALIGEKLRAARIRVRDATELATRVEELRDRDVQRAVAEERMRIVRDVHDITGHHLSAISLQAAGAGRMTPDPVAKAALERIHGLTTEALGQTRRALGVLRQDLGAESLAPAPRLTHVERLLEPAHAAGIAVELRTEGAVRELSETVEMCAYRVIQESLTNVVRHADARTVRVVIRYEQEDLDVSIEDDGRGAGGAPGRPGGGTEGMRERVALVGGELSSGPRAGGGWAVRATLPLERREDAA